MFDISTIPDEYIEGIIRTNVNKVRYDKYGHQFIGCCPICHEGHSMGRKTRFYYYTRSKRCFCFNCGYSEGVIKFIMDVTNKSFTEILKDCQNTSIVFKEKKEVVAHNLETLPKDSINLLDPIQLNFHKNNPHINKCLALIKNRKLDTAINKVKTLWFSLNDYVHQNRLILPFYDENNKIDFYQSRKIYEEDKESPKYLSKKGDIKGLFNLDNIQGNRDNLYIFEGPIDSCFVKNGIAVGGIQEKSFKMFTEKQEKQIAQYFWMKKIWVLDNQLNDNAAKNKSMKLLKQNQNVFIWPESHMKYKDFNDICIANNTDEVPVEFILENTYSGLKGLIKLKRFFN